MASSIVIVEDDFRFASEMMRMIRSVPEFDVLGHASTLAEGEALIGRSMPDILVIDLQLPDGDGVDLIARARRAERDMAILVFTIFGEEHRVIGAIEAGASGYLLKGVREGELIVALHQAAAGESPISPAIARYLLSRVRGDDSVSDSALGAGSEPLAVADGTAGTAAGRGQHPGDRLTPRELVALKLVAEGFIADEIGERMLVSVHTVRAHIRSIYAKLHVSRRVQAISEAQRRGYL